MHKRQTYPSVDSSTQYLQSHYTGPSQSEWITYLTLYYSVGNLQVASGQLRQAAKSFACAIILGCGGTIDEDTRSLGVGALDDVCGHHRGISRHPQAIHNIPDLITTTLRSIKSSTGSLLLAPEQARDCRFIVFPPTGQLPLTSPSFDGRGLQLHMPTGSMHAYSVPRTETSVELVVSNSLLNLAKIFQDDINSGASDRFVYLNGRVCSSYDILSLYFLSLSLSVSASTANNIGIILASMMPPATATYTDKLTKDLAVRYYNFGLSLDNKHPHLYTNLGSLLRENGRLTEAVQMYTSAIYFDPHFHIALANLAGCLKDQGHIEQAIAYYSCAVKEKPDFVESLIGLANCVGSVCNWTGRGSFGWETVGVDERGDLVYGSIDGWVVKVISILRSQLKETEKWGLGCIEAISASDDDNVFANIQSALGGLNKSKKLALYERLSSWRGQPDEGSKLISMIERLIRSTQWRWYTDRAKGVHYEDPSQVYCRPKIPSILPVPTAISILPFHAFTLPLTANEVYEISEKTATRLAVTTLSRSWLPASVYPPPPPPENGVLRVAYISSDFVNHPLAHLMQNVFQLHDRSVVQPYCYATTPPDNSHYRRTIEMGAHVFKDVSGLSTQQTVEELLQDGIHIAVNLNGFTKGGRNEIFAARPCPIQVSLMGFAGPMGADWCDYILGDSVAMGGPPPKEDRSDPSWVYRKERVIYMPRSLFCCDHRQSAPDSTMRRLSSGQVGQHTWEQDVAMRQGIRKSLFPNLPDGAILLGNFNQLYKIDPSIFATWLKILQRVPNAYLWLLEFPKTGKTHLQEYAARWTGSANVMSRILFTPVVEKDEHILRCRACDLVLDTPECNAHTTAADVIWSGTPILTFPRHKYKLCSRICASIVTGAVPDNETGKRIARRLIVASESEYEHRAVELITAAGLRELQDMRRVLFDEREVSTGLFDTQQWVRSLETGFRHAWNDWVEGRHKHIFVE